MRAGLLVVALLIRLGFVRRALAAYDPAPLIRLPVAGTAGHRSTGPDTLDLLTWNIGYAGLGRESDFVADGGRHLRARSRSLVEGNLEAIIHRLSAERADVLLVQELARDGYITRGVDVLASVRDALAAYQFAFAPTICVTGLPLVGNLEAGQGTFARGGISRAVRHGLPSPALRPGVVVQHFNVLESRLSPAGAASDWVIFNVHMPAFDDGDLRRQLLVEVLGLLRTEYEAGSHVVAGGDWNLRLAATSFPYTTDEKNKFWVRDLPQGLTAPGGSGPSTPRRRRTARSNSLTARA